MDMSISSSSLNETPNDSSLFGAFLDSSNPASPQNPQHFVFEQPQAQPQTQSNTEYFVQPQQQPQLPQPQPEGQNTTTQLENSPPAFLPVDEVLAGQNQNFLVPQPSSTDPVIVGEVKGNPQARVDNHGVVMGQPQQPQGKVIDNKL